MAYQINLAFLLLLLPLPIVLLLLSFLPGRVEHIVRTLPLNIFCELTCWLLILPPEMENAKAYPKRLAISWFAG